MDNNNPTPAAAGPTVPPPPPAPASTAGPAQATPPNVNPVTPNMAQPGSAPTGGSKKMMWILIAVALLVIVGGAAWYFMRPQTPAPTVTQTGPAKATPEDTVEEDFNSLDVETGAEAEFDTLDQDLQGL